MIPGPRGRAFELSYIPAPDLIRCRGEQLRRGEVRVAAMRPTRPRFRLRGEHALHRALRAVIHPLVEQRGVDLGGGQIDEARRMEHVEDLRAFRRGQCPRWGGAWRGDCGIARLRSPLGAIVRRGRHAERVAARAVARASCRCRSAVRFTRGSWGTGVGPRRGARCDVYSPSRRRSARSSPGFVHCAAASRIVRLSAAVNRRRVRVGDTPVSCDGSSMGARDNGTSSITRVH